jgi:hypothetical protein
MHAPAAGRKTSESSLRKINESPTQKQICPARFQLPIAAERTGNRTLSEPAVSRHLGSETEKKPNRRPKPFAAESFAYECFAS